MTSEVIYEFMKFIDVTMLFVVFLFLGLLAVINIVTDIISGVKYINTLRKKKKKSE